MLAATLTPDSQTLRINRGWGGGRNSRKSDSDPNRVPCRLESPRSGRHPCHTCVVSNTVVPKKTVAFFFASVVRQLYTGGFSICPPPPKKKKHHLTRRKLQTRGAVVPTVPPQKKEEDNKQHHPKGQNPKPKTRGANSNVNQKHTNPSGPLPSPDKSQQGACTKGCPGRLAKKLLLGRDLGSNPAQNGGSKKWVPIGQRNGYQEMGTFGLVVMEWTKTQDRPSGNGDMDQGCPLNGGTPVSGPE